MTKDKSCISCRRVLWILVFWGFGTNYMLRINLNLAIVTMVVPHEKSAAASECLQEQTPGNTSLHNYHDPANFTSVVGQNFTSTTMLSKDEWNDRFQWNEYQQGLVLGAYYWIHWLSQLPGGLLARKYGTKIVFGMGNLLVALVGFLIPVATHYSLNSLIFLRLLQGFFSGIVWPSMHDMTAKWIPPNERSRFVSSYLGSSVGAAITYPLCASIIDAYGWEAVFYITSMLGLVWYVFWLFLVYDSPRQHPRITDDEKNYILKSLAESTDEHNESSDMKSKKVPWKAILTSGPFWVTILAHWGGLWGFITFMTQAPSYFNYVQGWNIQATGMLSGLPHIARMAFSYVFSILADWLLRTKRMSLTGVRKLANFVCAGGQCILTIGLSFSGCAPIFAAFFMISGTAINGAISSGTIPSFVDLSPNYASILFGINNLMTAPTGFLSPIVVGMLTNDNQTIGQWRLVFLISAVNLGLSCLVHLIWGTSEEQPWNHYARERSAKKAEEAELEGEELVAMKPGTEPNGQEKRKDSEVSNNK
ncbi:na[+]-dependent inorganic phosphate cotransporter isoform X1 [Nasonia vitripennis]|uniref:Major facilitator superfamily (MFS) profile domain-containing protein n=2 Tax=Nasonia vitripennis TaxID=7425 RepID=A0A7M7QMZ6_NASVI|nr:Na[+]-dependent inorganic phosphate cotransporter [Nasonia vitripennis]XP_032452220.1 na[+]-dependent inorganic phosphate cotransporter isoform X1 [Nasonia vitripennis]XP_032452221.1 na[+]-dependent inorganic phosphate cotransporter isoform X1 [Nasonia vitripennis]